MCNAEHAHDLNRRSLIALAATGAGLALLPGRALAAGAVDALCIMCIDYRLVDNGVSFFDNTVGIGRYDIVALAGASLAGASPSLLKPTVPGFWQQIDVARDLHDINKVVVLDHMDCGAFKQEFNNGKPMPYEAERKKHIEMMQAVRATFRTRKWGPKGPPPGGVDFFLSSPVEHLTIP